MADASNAIRELLIVSLAPQNFERAYLSCPPNAEPSGDAGGWFKEHTDEIKKAHLANSWWRDNAFFIEPDLVLKPSKFIRRLVDFGYERAMTVRGRGLFAVRGGIIELWPLQEEKPYIIEFEGNRIGLIKECEQVEEKIKPHLVPQRSIEKLSPGSFVVHQDHGIGIFRGTADQIRNPNIESRNKSENQNSNIQKFSGLKDSNLDIVPDFEFRASNFFVIEYAAPREGAEPDTLYVPIDQKDRLTPYVGFETPRVHRLGGATWQMTKRKVREDAKNLAEELLKLYAARELVQRPVYEGDEVLERELRESFSFLETDDQLRAESEIMKDLAGQRPMDRILCGDVGFGKTEIALRSAFRVMVSGRQVALLSPTTILAAQHERTFGERLEKLPVKVAMLSRLTPPKEQKKILEELKLGKIDCIIGTHRLLSRDIEFADNGKRLGLVILDEEQRFGVKQKEKFKELRHEIDMLSLSATPIPRTLSLALARLRDISLIETPPPERLPISTIVLPYSKKIIERAINFELDRGGKIYFLHNRIETIGHVREKLRALKTKHRLHIEIIHGRMSEKEIMHAMTQFREGTCNILLATTIIENGLDISSANTLIVDEATRLGLAETHQLRGRIGRGSTQAFCYLLYPHTNRVQKGQRATRSTRYGVGVYRPQHLTEKALDRLDALKEYSELGSGYQIALRDLEIRGAGNVLGREQSGAINRVGLNLYCQMLAEAVENAKHQEKQG